MAEEKVTLQVAIDASQSAKTLGDLRNAASLLEEALEGAALGSDEFKQLNQELIQTNRQVKNLELGFEALDNEQVASELGSVAGAVGDVTAAFVLLGDESETMEEIGRNIEKGIGISMAFKGAIEGLSSAWKLLNNVMRANPIGAIITAVALLITGIVLLIKNWDELGKVFTDTGHKLKNLTDRLGENKEIILALIGPLGWIALAYEKIIDLQEELKSETQKQVEAEERLRTAQGKAALKRHQQRVDQIEEEREARQDAFNDEQEIFQLQIDRMEAEGKNANELKKAKIEAVLEEKEAELQTIKDLMESWTQFYEEQFRISGKSKEEFLALMKGQGIDLVALQEEANERLLDAQNDIFAAETDLIAFERELREQAHEETLEEIDEEAEARKRFQEERLKLLEEIEKAENEFLDSKLSNEQKEINAVRDKFFNLIEQAKMFGESTVILEEALQTQLQEIRDKFAEERAEKEKEQAEAREEQTQQAVQKAIELEQQRRERIQETAALTIDSAQGVLDVVQAFNDLGLKKDLKRIKEKQAAGERLTANEKKRLDQEAKAQKAFAVAQLAIDTARAISAGVASAAAVPFPGNIPAILSVVATVLANVGQAAKILSEPLPSVSGTGGETAPEIEQTENGQPSINPVQAGSTFLNPENQKVFVVESDITNAQNSVSVIEAQASFG